MMHSVQIIFWYLEEVGAYIFALISITKKNQ